MIQIFWILVLLHKVEVVSIVHTDSEEVECETLPESIFRNGIGDDSFFSWADKRIPFVIGEGFNDNHTANILDAVADYNRIFKGCLTWVERSDEVLKDLSLIHI